MPTLVALWSLRLAMLAGAGVAVASYAAGTPPLDAIDRALLAAVIFTFGGRWLLDRLESPQARLARMRAERAAVRAKRAGAKQAGAKEGRGKKKQGQKDAPAQGRTARPPQAEEAQA